MSQSDSEYDVVIVGASIAGCTAAMLYGGAGLRVALLERNRSVDSHKAMCGHFILGGAHPTLRRLGIWDRMLGSGAEAARVSVRVATGWVSPSADAVPPIISLRRRKLDPLLREMAAATPGVDLVMGSTVRELIDDGRGGVAGVRTTTADGSDAVLARLVVGADGHRSSVARLAGVPEDVAPNQRFLWWAYYRDVVDRPPGLACVWAIGGEVAVVVPAGDGLTLVGAFPSKERLADFAGDRVAAIERFVAALPDAPDLSRAERTSKAIGTNDYPFVRRNPTPRPGLALIGDAAMATDPVPAVGCTWAFRTAEWLADATAPALATGEDLGNAMRAYRSARRFADRYETLARREARGRPANRIQRLVLDAAPRDPEIARRFALFANRAAPPSVLLNPGTIGRALRANHRSRVEGDGCPDAGQTMGGEPKRPPHEAGAVR